MDRVVPWKGLIALIEPHYPKGEGGRPAYPLMAMLRVHLLQNWFGYSTKPPFSTSAACWRNTSWRPASSLSSMALGDRGLSLRQGTIVDATLINAPSSTKNKDGKRDPEMHQTKKGNQYYFGSAT